MYIKGHLLNPAGAAPIDFPDDRPQNQRNTTYQRSLVTIRALQATSLDLARLKVIVPLEILAIMREKDQADPTILRLGWLDTPAAEDIEQYYKDNNNSALPTYARGLPPPGFVNRNAARNAQRRAVEAEERQEQEQFSASLEAQRSPGRGRGASSSRPKTRIVRTA